MRCFQGVGVAGIVDSWPETLVPSASSLSTPEWTLVDSVDSRQGRFDESNVTLEADLLEVRRAAVEVRRVLEGLADPEHGALHEGLAEDLDAAGQAVREAARHRQAAQAEI